MIFDPNQKNVAPMYLGTVRGGIITFRPATMEKLPAATPAPFVSSTAGPKPYAQVGEEGVSYAGPHLPDLPAGMVRVVLFGPKAAAVAQSADVRAALESPQRLKLLPVESDQNWGAASSQLVDALFEDHAFAIVALDRNSAHLAEQLGIKVLVPVIALSGDKTLTSNNVPWIFRLPAETAPASALRLIGAAARQSGPNPERLRDVLASGNVLDGMAFLPTGEPTR
jgi:hypothetical protein